MIIKCVAILAIIVQISASERGKPSVLLSGNRVVASVSSDNFNMYSSGSVTKNFIGKGKFPIVLRDCGLNPNQRISVTTSHVTAPTQEKPIVRLPAKIPAPRVISHTCTCYKTIVRPRVHQQFITVPSIQRYIQTTHKPVVERYQYEAQANNCESPVQVVPAVQPVEVFQTLQAVRPVKALPTLQAVRPVEAFPSLQPLEAVQPVPAVEIVPTQMQRVEVPSFQGIRVPQSVSFGSSFNC